MCNHGEHIIKKWLKCRFYRSKPEAGNRKEWKTRNTSSPTIVTVKYYTVKKAHTRTRHIIHSNQSKTGMVSIRSILRCMKNLRTLTLISETTNGWKKFWTKTDFSSQIRLSLKSCCTLHQDNIKRSLNRFVDCFFIFNSIILPVLWLWYKAPFQMLFFKSYQKTDNKSTKIAMPNNCRVKDVLHVCPAPLFHWLSCLPFSGNCISQANRCIIFLKHF